jgi:uncharacterized iron-regulated protein
MREQRAGVGRTRLLALLVGLTLAAQGEARAPETPGLRLEAGNYVLDAPLQDLHDTFFVVVDEAGGEPRGIGVEDLADALSGYDVVFFGELHDHPGVHLQQQRLFRALHARHPRLVLSLEQFERDVQDVVDDYLAGKMGENALVRRGRAWSHYTGSYRPLVEYARRHGLPVVAAEAPGWAISCIGQLGPEVLDRFQPDERALLARELHFEGEAYRRKYFDFLGGSSTHGQGGDPAKMRAARERSFAAQVARDDTMAESIHEALLRHPGSRVLHLNGHFHSAGFLGTVERLRLRNPALRIAVIHPVEVEDPARPAFPVGALSEGTALLIVHPTPPAHVPGEDRSEWIRAVSGKFSTNRCKYADETAP